MRRYYHLLVREYNEDGSSVWTQQFGAYCRETVSSELEDMRDHGHKKKDLKIINCADSHDALMHRLAYYNQ